VDYFENTVQKEHGWLHLNGEQIRFLKKMSWLLEKLNHCLREKESEEPAPIV
jgi:hypothetical protein